MPELPEVEVVRRGLEQHVVGQRITEVQVFDARSVRRHVQGAVDFVARLRGSTAIGAHRRGKYLWVSLDSGELLVAHLGMSGQMLISHSDTPPHRHLRVRFCLSDGLELRFVDQRIFGGLFLSDGHDDVPVEISHIGRDVLDPQFDFKLWSKRLRLRDTGVKRALLDQSLMSGVGNIYADESLWRSRLHYARSTRTLRGPEVTLLADELAAVMQSALEQGGTSFDRLYVNVNGQSGYFDRSLAVYGREGQSCDRCGSIIRRERFMNRSSFTCPQCQPRPRNGRW